MICDPNPFAPRTVRTGGEIRHRMELTADKILNHLDVDKVFVCHFKNRKAEPEDFDKFWAAQKAKLDKVPVKATMKEVKFYNPGYKMYAVSVDCPGPVRSQDFWWFR